MYTCVLCSLWLQTRKLSPPTQFTPRRHPRLVQRISRGKASNFATVFFSKNAIFLEHFANLHFLFKKTETLMRDLLLGSRGFGIQIYVRHEQETVSLCVLLVISTRWNNNSKSVFSYYVCCERGFPNICQPLLQQSIDISCGRAHSSKPAAVGPCWDRQTDRYRTVTYRYSAFCVGRVNEIAIKQCHGQSSSTLFRKTPTLLFFPVKSEVCMNNTVCACDSSSLWPTHGALNAA